MTQSIIDSLLDTDLYKFTMMQCVFHHFPNALATYRFKCRKPVNLANLCQEIQQQISHLCQLRFQKDEIAYLETLSFFKPDFLEYLKGFQFKENQVRVSVQANLELIIHGPWLETILFEVPLLAIISESYYQAHFPQTDLTLAKTRLLEKIASISQLDYRDLYFSDFGTRRRFGKHWQRALLTLLKEKLPVQFTGTSNVFFAKEMALKPIGTMAHEYLQAFQVLAPNLQDFQHFALDLWLKEYDDKLAIALTDVLTLKSFLHAFDRNLAQRYKGLRQDSGDPIAWGEIVIKHYQALGIDPKEKIFVFSDNLNFPKMMEIYTHFKDRCQPYFGIGTNLTNDVGYAPLDIVIKLTHTNHHPVVKISDSKGKIICEDENYLTLLKHTFDLEDN